MNRATGLLAAAALALLAGCNGEEEAADEVPAVRPVRTITVTASPEKQGATFSGRIEAADRAALAFRIGGRLSERDVEVGTTVAAGDPIARLETQNEENAVRGARAGLVAAEAAFVRADNAYGRQSELYRRGVTARADLEAVEQARRAARAEVEAAEARLAISLDQLGFTALYADAPGVVTAIGAEPGEIVAAGQMIARVAREGGRDAVFDVPASQLDAFGPGTVVAVALAENPSVTATGRVREVAPQADPVTRTFRVRAGLDAAPEAMRLGMAVSGSVEADAAGGVVVPATAIRDADGASSVFVVDPTAGTVALRPVEIASRDPARAEVVKGLAEGDIVVTAGVNVLADGQAVRLSGAGS